MKKPTILIQIVLATAITILSVAAIASATTIGTNISTGGTLSVTGATTLSSDLTVSGNTIFSGIATSTGSLVASSTSAAFKVFGTTGEGSGTIFNVITSAPGSAYPDTSGIQFLKPNGTSWGSIIRANIGGGVYGNFMTLTDQDGDWYGGYLLYNRASETILNMTGQPGWGIVMGHQTADSASSSRIAIHTGAGSGQYRFNVLGSDGSVFSSGVGGFGVDADTPGYTAHLTVASSTEQLRLAYEQAETNYASFTVNSSGDLTLDLSIANATTTISDNFQVEGNLVASSTLQVYGTTREGTGTFIETIAQGVDAAGFTDSNTINLKHYDGTIYGSIGRAYHTGIGNYLNAIIYKAYPGDYGSTFLMMDANNRVITEMNSYQGLVLGDDLVDNASSVDMLIKDGTGSGNYRYIVDGATGNVGIGTSTQTVNLTVDGGGSATTTLDFNKACFKMITDDGTVLYYRPCLVNCPNNSGWATSTTSCF